MAQDSRQWSNNWRLKADWVPMVIKPRALGLFAKGTAPREILMRQRAHLKPGPGGPARHCRENKVVEEAIKGQGSSALDNALRGLKLGALQGLGAFMRA